MSAKRIIGFIGAGNMGGAIVRGLLEKGGVDPAQIWVADADAEKLARLRETTGVHAAESNAQVLERADDILLCVKPQVMPAVLAELRPHARPAHCFISIAAGVRTGAIETALGGAARVVRVMPNTPSLIGCGAAGLAAGAHATAEDLAAARAIFEAVGLAVVVEEAQLDAVTGLSGSGPAYFFFTIEHLIAAGVKAGLAPDVAAQLAKQTALGAARMACETGRSPAELREMVTSPGGTTFAGLEILREGGFPELIQACVARATERAAELGKG